jgi:hypothetical protein
VSLLATTETNDPAPRVIPAEKRPETLPVKPEPVSVVERVLPHATFTPPPGALQKITSPLPCLSCVCRVSCVVCRVSCDEQEVMKIFLKNEAYKSLVVTSDTTAKQICDQMAEKLNLGKDFGKNFDVTERVKRGEQYMGTSSHHRHSPPPTFFFILIAEHFC